MRFLESVFGALVDRSSDELIGALLIAAVVAGVMAGVYALGLRRASNTPVFVGGLVLASEVLCMTLTIGYIEYTSPSLSGPGSTPFRPAYARWSPDGQDRNSLPPPWAFSPAGWSSGFRIVVAADVDRDGRLTPEEAMALVHSADMDGDGSVDFVDIDRILSFRSSFEERRPWFNRAASPGKPSR
jgi:hypothetical protein